MDGLARINALSPGEVYDSLQRCCGSSRWADAMTRHRPYPDAETLYRAAENTWSNLNPEDWLEAFRHHPKIGDLESLRRRFAGAADWAKGEQGGVRGASEGVLKGLAEGNAVYERKFGFIFIVCATGKSADEMLSLLRERLKNDAGAELLTAAAEQGKITRIRLEKLLDWNREPPLRGGEHRGGLSP